jgi:hypothetical protein
MRREPEKIDWKFFHWLRLVNGKHAENDSKELDNGAVQQRERRNKPDRQREDGQAIDVARLVCGKTPDKAFHELGAHRIGRGDGRAASQACSQKIALRPVPIIG